MHVFSKADLNVTAKKNFSKVFTGNIGVLGRGYVVVHFIKKMYFWNEWDPMGKRHNTICL